MSNFNTTSNQNNNNNNIYPKSCVYNCNTQIYWNVATNEYWEVFTKKKHICPNRSSNAKPTNTTAATTIILNRPITRSPGQVNSLRLTIIHKKN
jgi:hypothetical protein